MKNIKLIISALFAALTVISCDTVTIDNPETDLDIGNGYRIKEYIYWDDADEYEKYTFHYSGQKLSEVTYSQNYNGEWAEWGTTSSYEYLENEWIEDSYYITHFKFDDKQKLINKVYYEFDNPTTPKGELTFSYTDTLLTNIDKKYYSSDGSIYTVTMLYSYSPANKLESVVEEESGGNVYHYEYTYSNNLLESIVIKSGSSDELSNWEKYSYSYNNKNQIIEFARYNWEYDYATSERTDNTWIKDWYHKYTYNENGLLKRIDGWNYEPDTWYYECTYEKGTGNAAFFYYNDDMTEYIYDYEAPQFKSARTTKSGRTIRSAVPLMLPTIQ